MKLLCPIDFSEPAAQAADVAAALATKRGLPLQIVYCAADWVMSAEIPVIDPQDQAAPEKLEAEAKRLAATGADVKSAMLMGTVHRQIATAAEDATEMIVMGSVGMGAAERWLVGSVAERVAESAPVPTLVVRNAEPLLAWLHEGRPLRVLCGVDFTVSADAAIAAVKQLMNMGPLELEAAYVSPAEELETASTLSASGVESEKMVSLERDVWERLQGLLGGLPAKVHVRGASGNSAFEFVRLADERKADLVILGTHQRHGLKRLSAPSFSRSVLHHTVANVLCVPVSAYKPEFRVPTIHRVLVATDFSEFGDAAIRHAYSLLPSGGSLQILHVCHSPTPGLQPLVAARVYFEHSMTASKLTAEAEEKLKTLIPRQLATAGVTTSVRAVQHDEVPAAICECAELFGADVICVGSSGHSAAATILLGSQVQDLISRSHRPVLVVPPPSV